MSNKNGKTSQSMTKTSRELRISNVFNSKATVTLFHGDRLELINQIAEKRAMAELIITSPPYNVGKEYEKAIPLPDYIEHQRQTIEACVKILSPTGSICWQLGNYIEGIGREKEAFPLDIL